jgi:hypothetical protein
MPIFDFPAHETEQNSLFPLRLEALIAALRFTVGLLHHEQLISLVEPKQPVRFGTSRLVTAAEQRLEQNLRFDVRLPQLSHACLSNFIAITC